jgi:hypothetical protein
MRTILMLSITLIAVFAQTLFAKPADKKILPEPLNGPMPWVLFPESPSKSIVDTLFIMGGPGSWDGSFDTPDGQPDWHGWTHEDATVGDDNHWHVSTYWADHIAGHGAGNHAMYCGQEDLPACSFPDTIGGYGDNYFDDVNWTWVVPDTLQPVTVHLTGAMTYDLSDAGYDFLELYVSRGSTDELLDTWTGTGVSSIALDYSVVLNPGDYVGSGSNEVKLWWRVVTDGGWSDTDCFIFGHGACQIDDLAVYIDDSLVTFDDFEPGSTVNWIPDINTGVGDFTNLRNDLGDADGCLTNTSYQVNFIDNGIVVPELPGTPCIQHCYDPDGWIVNNDGGLHADDPNRDWHLHNRIISPPLAWNPSHDGAELSFDVYVDETFEATTNAGMVYRWQVRSTESEDPADLELAPWKSHNQIFMGGPEYRRHAESVGSLLLPDRKWVQISLGVDELGYNWGFNGANGTPAPYFDNVAMRTWAPLGPEILVESQTLFTDNFASEGVHDPDNLGANSCRLDPQFTVSTLAPIIADTMVVRVNPMRFGAELTQPPSLHWVMKCNPTFDAVRPGTPNGQGLLRGMEPSIATIDSDGNPQTHKWTFDLPDEGWFYPGDVLHYYITTTSDLDGDIRTSSFPADTTGILDFSSTSSLPAEVVVRALPTLTQPVTGDFSQPAILFVSNSTDSELSARWVESLQNIGLVPGVDFDVVNILPRFIGLDGLASIGNIAGYQTILYSSGEEPFAALNDVHESYNDATFFSQWLNIGGKKALFAGNDFWSYTPFLDDGYTLANLFGVDMMGADISEYNGGQWDLRISPLPDNGALPDSQQWPLFGGCPDIQTFDAIDVKPGAIKLASLDVAGSTGGSYAAVVATIGTVPGNRTVALPFDLMHITGATTRSEFLGHLLQWLASEASPGFDNPLITQVTASAHPNPFNPSTTIAFELPQSAVVSLKVFDTHGMLVRTLLDDSTHLAGQHSQSWDGRDSSGRNTASGVYFYRLQAGDQQKIGKLTLLK